MQRGLPLLAALLLLGCSEKPAPIDTTKLSTLDSQGWPVELYYARLPMPEEKLRAQAVGGTAPGYNLVGPKVIKKHYDQIGPTAHGASKGTDVFWLPEENVFFLRSDCEGHHVDGFIGPIEGDPRKVLEPVEPPLPRRN